VLPDPLSPETNAIDDSVAHPAGAQPTELHQ